MSAYKAFSNYDKLKKIIENEYGLYIDSITLINDWCASVYFLNAASNKYIFKLYRSFDTTIAIQAVDIMNYLSKQSFPVAAIINTKNNRLTTVIPFGEDDRVGVLFNFIEGTMGYDLNFESYATEIGEMVGLLHLLMSEYDKPLIQYGKEHYVGRTIDIMKKYAYSLAKVAELSEYGDKLWDIILASKSGFNHGDLNPSNYIKANDGKLYVFDFDCAGLSYPINDIFMICNSTESMPRLNFATLDNPKETLSLLRIGYEKYFYLNNYDIKALYASFGLNCYWMVAQEYKYKSHLEGHGWLVQKYFDEIYNWLTQWESQYEFYFGKKDSMLYPHTINQHRR